MTAPAPHAAPASLWASTASLAPAYGRLEGDVTADVAIVGGGYTGLCAAHALARRGARPVVLEANTIGWGASGRNGGVVSPKFRMPFPRMAQVFGLDTARRMHRIAHDAVTTVEQFVTELGIDDAGFELRGNLRCAHTERTLAAITEEAEWLRRELSDTAVSTQSAEAVAAETGATGYHGGVLNTHAGTIHPLNYVNGLAAGLASTASDTVFERSPVVAIKREPDGVRLETPDGSVRARQAILATNAYSTLTGATRETRRTHIPFRSAIIATEKLPDELDRELLTERRSYGDTRRMMRWFRKSDGRVLFGGRGAFGKEDSAAAFNALRKAMIAQFPALADVPVAFRWSGHVGMTLDQLPHVGRLDEHVTLSLGYNGAGVAMSSLLGTYAAAFALGERPDVGPLGVEHLKPVPFYPLRELGVRCVAGWYQFLDVIGL